ncbi:MAG: CinA family protein [Devosia sp.]
MPAEIGKLAHEVIAALRAKHWTLATAESCTGGLVAGALTSVPGSSDVVYGGFVTYANEAKIAMVGVPFALLREFGAVSKEVSIAMAEGAMHAAGVHVAVAITGIAGPDGGSADKPVGLVHLAVATAEETRHLRKAFDPNWSRDRIRHASLVEALKLVKKAIA